MHAYIRAPRIENDDVNAEYTVKSPTTRTVPRASFPANIW